MRKFNSLAKVSALVFLSACGVNSLTAHGQTPVVIAAAGPTPTPIPTATPLPTATPTPTYRPQTLRYWFADAQGQNLKNLSSIDSLPRDPVSSRSVDDDPSGIQKTELAIPPTSTWAGVYPSDQGGNLLWVSPVELRFAGTLSNCPIKILLNSSAWSINQNDGQIDWPMTLAITTFDTEQNDFVSFTWVEPTAEGLHSVQINNCGNIVVMWLERQSSQSPQPGGQ